MAPKPRPIHRRLSTAGKDGAPSPLSKTPNSQLMPPPPVPAPPVVPKGILVPEAQALSGCLRAAAVNSGKMFRFYADTQRLRIHRHAPYPPRALVSSVGRELEKYDQLCDALQSNINRAISVLKRDLEREKNKIKAAEEEAAAKAALASAPFLPNSPLVSPTDSDDTPLAELTGIIPGSKNTGFATRRQSTISLSSLSRPFPHKLDLSSAALRLNPEDLARPSGLASPVMLAPKSSISRVAPDYPFDNPESIDLTLDDDVPVNMSGTAPPASNMDPTLGSSADKPIELLDLEMDMELFGGSADANQAAGPSTTGTSSTTSAPSPVKPEAVDFGLFNEAFQSTGGSSSDSSKAGAELLASLTAVTAQLPQTIGPDASIGPTDQHPQQQLGLLDSSSSLFAGLQAASDSVAPDGRPPNATDPTNFDAISLDFLKDGEMLELFNLNTSDLGQQNGSTSTAT